MKKLKMIILMICLTLSCVLITGCGCEKEKFIVTFNSNGGSYVESQTVEKNGTASVPIEPIRDGYIFIEWLLDDVKYDFTTKVTKDITLKANWGLSNLKTYTVTFNSNGGSNVASVKVSEGNTIFSLPTPTRNGYVFMGWYLGNTEYNSTTKINKDITLVAKWEQVKENEYTVTFDSNNGSWVKNQKVEEGNKVTKPSNPTRTGYTFVKWQLDGEDFDFNTKVTKDITLVAVWKKKAQYTVSFNTNGGNQVSSVKVYEGNKVTKPTDPTRDGYTFVKWQLDGKDYDFSSKVTGDIKLVAVWEEITKYTVTFDTNGGSTIDSVKVYENEVVSKPTNPTKDKHNFVKWQLDGKDYDFSSKVTGDITLIAVWEKTEYTVSFDTDGGSSIANQTVTKGETVTEPTNPTKEGFDFVKWQLDDKDYDFSSKVTDDITLKAIWEEVVITCKIEEIEDSQVGQVRVFVFRNEEIVDGIADITTINGKVKTVEISKDGYITNGAIIESIDNVKVK